MGKYVVYVNGTVGTQNVQNVLPSMMIDGAIYCYDRTIMYFHLLNVFQTLFNTKISYKQREECIQNLNFFL